MFGIGLFEIVVIFIVALLVYGPEKLPEIAREVGSIVGKLRKTTDSVKREFYSSVYEPLAQERNRFEPSERSLQAFKDQVQEHISAEVNTKTDQKPQG